jgi:DNA repair ATPase RecN
MTPSLPSANHLSTLYEQDYYLWLETTAKLLRDGQLSALDAANLLEEIEDMGRSEKRLVYSNLKIILMHLLKYKYQPEKRSNSWIASIVEHRQRLKKALKESPSLQPYFTEVFNECYQDARELAAAETGLAIDWFPVETPFTPEEILTSDYLSPLGNSAV